MKIKNIEELLNSLNEIGKITEETRVLVERFNDTTSDRDWET